MGLTAMKISHPGEEVVTLQAAIPSLYLPMHNAYPRIPFEGCSDVGSESNQACVQIADALRGVIDDASYGWNPLLEDQVQWCVWSAPDNLHIAYLLNILASTLMEWGIYREAGASFQKALSIGLKTRGPNDPETISTMVLLSGAIWKAGRVKDALLLLQSAGESFARCEDGHLTCLATRCLLKVAAAYDALGWHKQAESVWDQVTDLL